MSRSTLDINALISTARSSRYNFLPIFVLHIHS
jgi:hypothetical protein